jgi:4-aminobutyrate aminotransferase-like enzyme
LQVIERDNLVSNAREVGAIMMDELRGLAQRHEAIGDVRGAGLFLGVEVVKDRIRKTPDPKTTTKLVNGLRRKRVLIGAAGPNANVLKIRPPIVFTRANVDTFIGALDEVLCDF